MCSGSNRFLPLFFRADADGLFDVGDEDFAVADLAGLGGFDDCGHGGIQALVADYHLKLYLRQEIYRVFAAAINLRVAFLTPEAFNFADRHPLDPDLSQGVLNFFQLKGLDYSFDFFHTSIRNVLNRGALADPVECKGAIRPLPGSAHNAHVNLLTWQWL